MIETRQLTGIVHHILSFSERNLQYCPPDLQPEVGVLRTNLFRPLDDEDKYVDFGTDPEVLSQRSWQLQYHPFFGDTAISAVLITAASANALKFGAMSDLAYKNHDEVATTAYGVLATIGVIAGILGAARIGYKLQQYIDNKR